jgi:hypothetical protein
VFSLDAELAWGTFDIGGHRYLRDDYLRTRGEARRLLALQDRYNIPSTWAFVGHLMIDSCERCDGTTHADVLRPRYDWYPRDWHHLDPGTNVKQDPLWYGTDMLEWVMKTQVRHDIGSHTFTHIIVGDPACTREIALSQFRKCVEVHARYGLKLDSVVFPRNKVAHLDVLRELGIVSYRGPEQSWYQKLSGAAYRAGHLIDNTLAVEPPTYPLEGLADRGLVNVPGSMFLLPTNGIRKMVPSRSRRRQALRGLRRAAERGEIFHLWLHPVNLACSPIMPQILEEVFQEVDELRRQGRMIVRTMADMARDILQIQKGRKAEPAFPPVPEPVETLRRAAASPLR